MRTTGIWIGCLWMVLLPFWALPQSHDKFRFGFSERFRMLGWDNAIDLDKEGGTNQHFSRHRTTAGVQWQPADGLQFEVKLTHEFRKYFTPANAPFHWNEVFFDQLYFSYASTAYLKGKLTLGRQNIFLGEGFVVWDGHPVDGSRSAYFNALRYDLKLSPAHKVTAFVALQPDEDRFLPVLNGKDVDAAFQGDHSYQLIEQSEKAAVVYYVGSGRTSQWDVYVIWKTIAEDGAMIVPKSDIRTYGFRWQQQLGDPFVLRSEAAWQSGMRAAQKHRAFGGYAFLDFATGLRSNYLPDELKAGLFMLSGDDQPADKHTAWEPVFGRWPKWSESYIYTSLRENQGRIAYWSNMLAPSLQSEFRTGPTSTLKLAYYRLFAMQHSPQTDFLSGSGKDRGHLLTARLGFQISRQLTGHVLWEHFRPGNFYFHQADPYHWARIELLFVL